MTVISDVIVVGAGFAGAVIAERLASAGRSVVVVDRRDHIGGNAHDRLDAHGVLIHPYGPHIFHTNSQDVVEYLSRFTQWRAYSHRVLARVQFRGAEHVVPIPINRTTINTLFATQLDSAGIAAFLEARREARSPIRSSEDVVISTVGRELYELFFRGYTRKQWGLDPSALDASVTARIPTRHDDDDRYFTDTFQHMPRDGYGALFARMLEHPNIRVELGTALNAEHAHRRARFVVWTGPLDAYFANRFGALPWRSLRFEHSHLAHTPRALSAPVINEPDPLVPYTRTTEFRWLTGQQHSGTSLVREFPQAEGDPYYPIPASEAKALYQQYHALANAEPNTLFVGRLAQYRYYNMDQVVAAALTQAAKLLGDSA